MVRMMRPMLLEPPLQLALLNIEQQSVIIIAAMVLLGAAVAGHNNISKLSSIATNNEVVASADEVDAAVASESVADLCLKSALKAFIIFTCAGITVFGMSYLKFPVSANQSITGAVIGWGLCYADYSAPEIMKLILLRCLNSCQLG